ncbi:hypothetical protein [Salinispora vitiensis]|uniref:hypothetical protein n=1 Tax=Salinispora vitiensis TaxID=999544 RepID=UPI00036488C2|nr:hypothetical protein [Salinispora vitiensis]
MLKHLYLPVRRTPAGHRHLSAELPTALIDRTVLLVIDRDRTCLITSQRRIVTVRVRR